MSSSTITQRSTAAGPPLLAPAAAYGILTIASVAAYISGPRPGTAAEDVLHYVRSHVGLLHAAALLIFAASVPLAVWTGTVHRRLRALGIAAPGVDIALAGGVLAAGSLALSGLVTWATAASAHSLDPAVARTLTALSFATGAAGFVVPFSLLLAGVAVPSLIRGLAPRPLAWAGIVIAGIGMLSTFTLMTDALDPTLPIARFGGLLWIIAMSLTMERK